MAFATAADYFARYPSRKLNLGSGADLRDGYTNVDMHDYGAPNSLVGDVTRLPDLPSGAFEEIVAQDIIEHIQFRRTPELLFERNRLLATGGRLYIRTTCLNGLVRLMEQENHRSTRQQLVLLTNLFSRQLVPGDYHFTAFTEPLMRFYLWASGFAIDSLMLLDGWIFEVWARKVALPFDPALMRDGVSDAVFVDELYRTVLGREPDEAGSATYRTQLAAGADRLDVVRSVWTSEEKQRRLVEDSPEFGPTLFTAAMP